jgi:hypothetical protein
MCGVLPTTFPGETNGLWPCCKQVRQWLETVRTFILQPTVFCRPDLCHGLTAACCECPLVVEVLSSIEDILSKLVNEPQTRYLIGRPTSALKDPRRGPISSERVFGNLTIDEGDWPCWEFPTTPFTIENQGFPLILGSCGGSPNQKAHFLLRKR